MPGDRAPRIPPAFKAEYLMLLRRGMTPTDAQALLCFREGLAPADGQRQPWTLEELVRLRFVLARASRTSS